MAVVASSDQTVALLRNYSRLRRRLRKWKNRLFDMSLNGKTTASKRHKPITGETNEPKKRLKSEQVEMMANADAPDKNIYMQNTSCDLSSHWSASDQISQGTAHFSFCDQWASGTGLWGRSLSRTCPTSTGVCGIKAGPSSQTVGGNSEFSSRLDAWNRLNLVKGGRTRGTESP